MLFQYNITILTSVLHVFQKVIFSIFLKYTDLFV